MTTRPALVPELACTDLARSLAFYVDLLGFEIAYERPEERFAYLSLASPAGTSAVELMLDEIRDGGTAEGYGWNTARLEPPFGRGINLQIEIGSVDDLRARLHRRDWPVFRDLHDAWYRAGDDELGNRQLIVLDPDGYQLRLFSSLGTRPSVQVGIDDAPDSERFGRFLARCFEAEYAPMHDAATVRTILEWIRSAEGTGDVLATAREDTRVIAATTRSGTLLGTTVFAERAGHVYAWGVYVDPDRLREGIGSRLMACLCGHASPASVIELSVLEASAGAIRFYEALGFVERTVRTAEVFPGVHSRVRVMHATNATCRERLSARGYRTNN